MWQVGKKNPGHQELQGLGWDGNQVIGSPPPWPLSQGAAQKAEPAAGTSRAGRHLRAQIPPLKFSDEKIRTREKATAKVSL